MRTVEEGALRACPECGGPLPEHGRFTAWCAGCDWNVDPEGGREEPAGRGERIRRRLAERHGERLLADLTADGVPVRLDAFGVLSFTLALAVHAVTVVLLVCGALLLAGASGFWSVVGGLLALGAAWTLRPRLGRLPRDGIVLRRADAPELYALVDEVGRAVGTRGVDAIVVDAEFNASVSTLGVRRRMLTLGVPLWEVLTPRERVALLGHELGHFVNGDTRHGLVVGSALRSLTVWHDYFQPYPRPGDIFEVVTNLLLLPFRYATGALLTLLDLVALRASQRCEYLADAAAARAGSTGAAVALMDRFLVADPVEIALRREVNARRMNGRGRRGAEAAGAGLWEALAEYAADVPESEYERRRRVGALRGHSVDSTHPPTHLRRQCLLRTAREAGTVVTDGAGEGRIAAELAEARARVARELVRDGLDGT
ncbi:M48 family metallopeptidase [Streptomyces sp. NPDC006997]|uniref:M48 family metallopeptidase n=1 Tax=Streptomyces sp. NPDC006997 TaxID=3155356 RepID=UPI0033EF9D12